MAEVLVFAEVRLWGRTVGGVAELDDGRIVFEYDPAFRMSGLELSPVRLPLATRGPVRFDELVRKDGFQGLPGLLADALPDAFGTAVIRAFYTSRGEERKAFSPVQHLLYVGERAIGALEFRPAEKLPRRAAEAEALEVAELVADARRIIAGHADVTIPEIYRIGSSAGGMRPKAVVLHNPATGEIRSAFATPQAGDIPCILKFDGVGEATTAGLLGEPQPFNRVEAAYAHMARAAGLDVVDVAMHEGDLGHAHLLIPRFDFRGGERLHQHTLGGLLHVDYNDPGASSYEEYLRTILRLGMPPAAVIEGFRRMTFNILAVNQDDHVKNLSFHMDTSGAWSLTPAYDLTFAKGGGWTMTHQMRVAGKRSGITRTDLIEVAEMFGLRNPAGIIAQVADAVGRWPECAADQRVPAHTIALVQSELDARAQELGSRKE
ncbi:MAG TPA: type II toxin-antitoxin system HipA family toxin [Longimicrobiales bacterium]|nr:type II toxin-antitoxin system HipA family toxin [Longimicrobiales bacterium]